MSAPAISDKDMEDFFTTATMATATHSDPLFESSFFDNSTYGFDWSSPFASAPTTSHGDAIATGDAALFDAFGRPSQLALDLSPSSAFDLVLRPATIPYSAASARSNAPRSRKLVHQLRPDGQGISSTELLSLEGQGPLSFPLPQGYTDASLTGNNGYADLLPPSCSNSNSNMLPSTPPITPNPARVRPRTSTSPLRKHRPAPIQPITASGISAGPPAAKRSKSHSMLKSKPMHPGRRSPKHQHSYHQLSMLQTSNSTVPNLPLSPPASSRLPAEAPSLSARSSVSGLQDYLPHNAASHGSNSYSLSNFSTSSPTLWGESASSFDPSFGNTWSMDANPVFDTHQLHPHQHSMSADPLSAASGSSLESQPPYGTWDTDLAQAGLMISTCAEGYPWNLAHSADSTTTSISPEVAPSSSSTTTTNTTTHCDYPIASSSAPSQSSFSSSYDSGNMNNRYTFPRARRSTSNIAHHKSDDGPSAASTSTFSSTRISSTSSTALSSKPRSKKSYSSLKGLTSPRKARSTTTMHSTAISNSGNGAGGSGAHSSSGGAGAGAGAGAMEVGFVNFTPSDSRKILTGVAPSGSSKTKARREREAIERRRRLSEAATRAVREAGGDLDELKRTGVLELEELMR